ncbi:MAG TPA: DUF3857 domain-containing protein [Puia sp.]|jgi:hypothetical protein|nr:DUF3857 domain-containing protein [Puia sp.]
MNPTKRTLLLHAICLLMLPVLRAQDKLPVKFGKVTPDDFKIGAPASDTGASAVVIADYGTSTFEGNMSGWFDIVFKHSKRIRILKRNGFDAAKITIPLYVSGTTEEKIEGLKAVTYNLEDGKVVETKLDDKSIFTDKLSKHSIQKKFSFPALKEGSIVEFTYTQKSPFIFQLQPWAFQGEYPCLWSEYQVDMPAFFQYVTMSYGFVPFSISTTDSRSVNFKILIPGGAERDYHEQFDDQVTTHRWVMKDVPPLKAEAYTTSIFNYLARIEFQLAAERFPWGYYKDHMGNWIKLSEELLANDEFGADLDKGNGWLDDDLKTVTQGAKTDLEKTQRIFAYVRDKFNCTSHSNLGLSDPLKTVYKNRHGNVAEVNLLLAAMLRHEKIKTDPVILSTRSHGFANPVYPLLDRFNYVIDRVTIDSSEYYLDASEPWLGFGKLPERCYNGYARVLNKEMPTAVSLDADNVNEKKITLVILSKDENGSSLSGRLQTFPGYNEACVIREKVKSSGEKEYTKKIETAYSGDATASNFELDSLTQPDDPLQLNYDLKITPDSSSDIFYFNPMLGEAYKENPFKAAERRYPVEMPFAMDETYTLTMEVPDGYVVDEVPKSAKVLFNDDEGFFEYLISKGANEIQLRSRIKLNKANFKPEDYATLRDFFGYVVKKQSEQIVFKKKKA